MPNSSSPLVLILLSVEHLTPERRAEIGTVFDAHPLLRPGKVGQDPPRTRVGSTLVPHLAQPDLPLFLLGGEGARTEESATWIFELEPAWIVVGGRGDAEEVVRPVSSLTIVIGPERAAALGAHGLEIFLGEIGDAIGGAYGCIFPEATYDQLNRWYADRPARPDLSWGLGSVYWMQYLGPAFVERRPALAQLERSATTPRGAVIHRATEQPEHSLENSGSPLDGEWQAPLLSALGEDVILISLEERDTMPSLEHHASFDPGRVGPPEDLVRRIREDAERRRRRREAEYDRARTRRLRLEGRRPPLMCTGWRSGPRTLTPMRSRTSGGRCENASLRRSPALTRVLLAGRSRTRRPVPVIVWQWIPRMDRSPWPGGPTTRSPSSSPSKGPATSWSDGRTSSKQADEASTWEERAGHHTFRAQHRRPATASAALRSGTMNDASAEPVMSFRTRKWVRPEDLNANGTLFGGSLLRWIDEEAAVYAIIQLGQQRVVTKYMSEIVFVSSAREGDIVEIGLVATAFGRSSLTMRAEARNLFTQKSILTIEEMVFVHVDEQGRPAPHGFTEITYDRDRVPARHRASEAEGTSARS